MRTHGRRVNEFQESYPPLGGYHGTYGQETFEAIP
jgi:hypothetical protein